MVHRDNVIKSLVRERGLEPLRRDYLASRFQTCCVFQFRHSRTQRRAGRGIFAKISYPAHSELSSYRFFDSRNLLFHPRFSSHHSGYSIEKRIDSLRRPSREFGHFNLDAHIEVDGSLGGSCENRRHSASIRRFRFTFRCLCPTPCVRRGGCGFTRKPKLTPISLNEARCHDKFNEHLQIAPILFANTRFFTKSSDRRLFFHRSHHETRPKVLKKPRRLDNRSQFIAGRLRSPFLSAQKINHFSSGRESAMSAKGATSSSLTTFV